MAQRSFVIQSATIHGVEALPVLVEVVISSGIPSFSIVGMADATIMESRERVKAALRASGFVMPTDKIVVNLAPGALRKNWFRIRFAYSAWNFGSNRANQSRMGCGCSSGWGIVTKWCCAS